MENREKILVIDPKSGLERFIGNLKCAVSNAVTSNPT